MPSTYTNQLRFTKQGDGDNLNTWGQILNAGVFELIEDAISTIATIDATALASYSLTTNNGSIDEARCAGIEFTGTPLGPVTITIPVASKIYIIRNATTQNLIISTGNPTTRTLAPGVTDLLFTRGAAVFSLLASAIDVNAPVPVNKGGTGVTTLSAFLTNLLPSQTGNGGKFLQTNGTTPSWQELSPWSSGDLKFASYAAVPSGWLAAGGQAVSRATYAALFAVLGTYYGAGDGSTTFNLPDLRGRTAVGLDNLGGTAANRVTSAGSGITGVTLGATGGAENHTLTEAQIPSHRHFTLHASGSAGIFNYAAGITNAPVMLRGVDDGGLTNSNFEYHMGYTAASANANTAGSSLTGGGAAHNNMQPSFIGNWLIKT